MRTKKTTSQTSAPALFTVQPKQQPKKKDWQDSSKELRIRNFSEKHKQQLKEIMKVTKKPFESYAVEFLIENYLSDQSLIKQLEQRNSQLHAGFNKLMERENDVKDLLQAFLSQTVKYNNMIAAETKKLMKQFKKKGTVGATRKASGSARSTKTVPKKKGGKR